MAKVLIACERSAIVRDEFRALGHEAWSCDLEPCEGDPRWHIQYDAGKTARSHPWDLMIAHPECRYLSSSGLHWNGRRPGRSEKTQAALAFVAELFFSAGIPLIALENPQGCINPTSSVTTRARRPVCGSRACRTWLSTGRSLFRRAWFAIAA